VIPLCQGEHIITQPHGHLQGVGSVVVVAAGEVAQLLDQQPRAGRAALEAENLLRQEGRQPADADLLVDLVVVISQ